MHKNTVSSLRDQRCAIIPCAQCHESLFMPEWSEHLDERRVRHCWQCDACDYAFETIVSYGEAVAA